MINNTPPLILITNDDGYDAPGLKTLIECAEEFGDIVILAPDKPQSGMGHAVTIAHPLRLFKKGETSSRADYTCSGTPVDAVKLALDVVCKRKPDLVLSGINHGSNASVNVIYSGTMGAAIEACLSGIKAIGFSLNNYSIDANFKPAIPFVKSIIKQVLDDTTENLCLNVNIPDTDNIKGIKVCRQAKANWVEEFDVRQDPHHRTYYWLKGYFSKNDDAKDTDEHALSDNYISIVPITIDFTNHAHIQKIKYLEKDV